MKKLHLSLTKKLWLTITASIIITILFSYFLSHLFYEKLYVDHIEVSLLIEGNLLAADYESGPLTDELRDQIDWYNSKNESEVFVVSNPRELSACLPFEIDYETLIGAEEREELLKGNPVTKMGYEERFDRQIMAVIIPLLDENGLEGIIYLYLPLAKITELMKNFSYLWLIAALLFGTITIYLGTILVQRLTNPLKQMKDAAERVSRGDYSVKIQRNSNDEIGQLAEAFNHMSSSIQKEDERKKEFLANVSHELRTPISYVLGYSDAMLTGVVKKEEEHQKYLQLIHREAGRMERLVGDLLDLTKLDTQEYRLDKMPLPLAQLVEDATQKYIPIMKEKGLTFSLQLDPDIIVNGDEGRIEQVVQNIMDNALRYTELGGITITLQRESNECILMVKDTGIGIPEEDLEKIKHRFYRVNKARTRLDGGTGLGLAITDKIVHLHGGKLLIDSIQGKGTTVEITLPVIDVPE
ncbi:sensor histidine kinase [Cytobacillus sp. FJAT-54145]|uniref:histidine kinase n=1 Tax=Cytobacillus spartinae TaxID=3299023 RepID=A0ABW6KCT2_9BACI